MISPSEIEDQPLLLGYAVFQAGAERGSFVCASIAPALLYEVEARFKGAIRSDSPPIIAIESRAVEQTDISEAIIGCLALQTTCQKLGYGRGSQFATELLKLIDDSAGIAAPWLRRPTSGHG